MCSLSCADEAHAASSKRRGQAVLSKRAHLANAEKIAYVAALVRFEKGVDALLFQIKLSEVARWITRVKLRASPH
jgi:hypothetical protein